MIEFRFSVSNKSCAVEVPDKSMGKRPMISGMRPERFQILWVIYCKDFFVDLFALNCRWVSYNSCVGVSNNLFDAIKAPPAYKIIFCVLTAIIFGRGACVSFRRNVHPPSRGWATGLVEHLRRLHHVLLGLSPLMGNFINFTINTMPRSAAFTS